MIQNQPPQEATQPAPPEAPQGAPDTAQAPPPPLPVDEGPFAPTIAPDGTQVAGKGAVLRPLLKKLLGGGKPGPEDAGEAVEDAIVNGLGEQDIVGKARTAPTMTAGPMGAYPGTAEAVTGTTRPLPNVDYFESQPTKQVLGLLESRAVRARAGPVKRWAQTKELAESRKTLLKITGKPVDSNWSPEELLALRNSLEVQAKELDAMARDLHTQNRAGNTPSPAQLAQFELASQRLVATNNAVSGLASRAGQLLNSLRIPATDTGMQVRHLVGMVDASGGSETVLERVGAVVQAQGDPARINEVARDTWGKKAWDMALKVRYNMMLASVRTHAANVAGSTITGGWEYGVINPLAWAINRAERTGRKIVGMDERIEEGIVGFPYTAEAQGLVRGARNGIALAFDIARGAEVPAESLQGKFINESGMRYRPQDQPGNVVSTLANTPTRMLEAEDAFFRSTYYNARLESLARARAAAAETPEERDAMFQALMEAPPDELRDAAKEYSQKLTFTNDPNIYGKTLGTLAQGVAQTAQYGVFRLLVPFVKTPANLFGYATEAGGLGPMLAPMRTMQQIKGTPRERAEAIARTTAATGLIYALYDYVGPDGLFTGMGSGNSQAVRLMESSGWRANSMKVGDKYYELNRMDPMGLTVSAIASGYEIANERNMSDADKTMAFAGITMQIAEMMLDRSYMQGVGQLFKALTSGEAGLRSLNSMLISTGASFVTPNVLRDFREGSDEFRREQAWDMNQPGAGAGNRFLKNLYNALPGYSKELPVALDWKGDPITNDGHFLFRAMVPVRTSEMKEPNPATMALIENNIYPGYVRPVIAIPQGAGMMKVPLLSERDFGADGPNGHVYSYYKQLVGKAREKLVGKLVGTRDYATAMSTGFSGPDSPVGRQLRNMLDMGRDQAMFQFFDDINRGRKVTLYPGSGAEVQVQLPKIDTSQWTRALREFARLAPDERETFKPPPGMQYTPRKVTPRF